MFYLTMWFIQGMLNILFKVFLIFFCFLLSSSFSFMLKKFPSAQMIPWLIFPLMFFSQPSFMFFIFSSFMYMLLIFIMKSLYHYKTKTIFWVLNKETLKSAIKIREMIFISDQLYFFLVKLKTFLTLLSFIILFIMFASYHQLFILLILSFLIVSAILSGLSLSFFMNFLSLIISKPKPQKLLSPTSFPNFLKTMMNHHPLNAMIEESFFEDNLQMGEFYLVFPIFFKSAHPSPNLLSFEQEVMNVWHLIRWESALSKQTGSAASRWSSLYSITSMPPQSSIHSMHTPLIPIYSEKLYTLIISNNLPYFDPLNQPPYWSPYILITNFLKWDKDDINEERINEMEEEE